MSVPFLHNDHEWSNHHRRYTDESVSMKSILKIITLVLALVCSLTFLF
jgi:hypothetical protein